MDIYRLRSLKETVGLDPYVGRGIIVGTTPSGKPVVAYFIMGRSVNSRNRVFEMREDGLYTKAFDESKVADPSLIIYRAAATCGDNFVVTNGDQTDTIIDALKNGGTFESALSTREFEPDAPNFTPRISAMVTCGAKTTYKMSILKSVDAEGSDCARFYFNYPAKPGAGHFIHTYVGNGTPLPSFQGEPELIAIPEDTEAFAKELWETLDSDNKISLYVKVIGGSAKDTYIFNKNGDGKQ
ncbi:MAG: IMP cyclohydrolase [Clostridia bacterium]|nr:IMP cyclohydrolase [Clostridia bacterium]